MYNIYLTDNMPAKALKPCNMILVLAILINSVKNRK